MLFKDVLVDESLKKQLISLVNENRISHAQLFLSQAGSHSFALAVAFAQYICCEHRGENDSCGVCPSCAKFAKLSHPDLHLIFPNCTTNSVKKDPESALMIEDFRNFVMENNYHISLNNWLERLGGENKQASINIRDCASIINQNSIRAYEGGYKIYILWMVERLYHAAAPKLLKTLEEPENKSLFILITENSDKILSTILSRTQLVKIPKLKTENIRQQLVKDFGINDAEAEDIAKLADGNYNKAIELSQGNSEYKEMLKYVALILGSISALSKPVPNRTEVNYLDVKECFEEIVGKGREYQKNFMNYFVRILRDLLLHASNNDSINPISHAEASIVNSYASLINLKNISKIMDECNKAIYHIERNGNSAIILTDWYLKLSKLVSPSL